MKRRGFTIVLTSFCLLVPIALRVAHGGDDANHVALTIDGGHDTDPRDHGRPVALIAAALGVPDDVFREAFIHVRPEQTNPRPDYK